MANATVKYGLHYPEVLEAADGPANLGTLAGEVETLLSTGTVDLTLGRIRVAAPDVATAPTTKAYVDAKIVIGPAASAPAAGGQPNGSIFLGY